MTTSGCPPWPPEPGPDPPETTTTEPLLHHSLGHDPSYNEMWADEAGWRLQFRCKICPDAIGETADVAALDVWPGGSPTGDDEGFNGILVRTMRGDALVRSAVEAGHLVVDDPLQPRQIDDFQPHQVRRKRAVWARLAGLRRAGHPLPEVVGLRMEDLARQNDLVTNLRKPRAPGIGHAPGAPASPLCGASMM